MKILCFGDLHAHPFKDFSKSDDKTGNTRLTAIIQTLDYIGAYAKKYEIDLILDAGDLFHKRNNVDTTTYNAVFDSVKRISDRGTPMLMIPGNHTQVDNSDMPETSIEPFAEIENVEVLKDFEPYPLPDGRAVIYPAPYSKNADMVKAHIEQYAENVEASGQDDVMGGEKPTPTILLGHLGVTDAEVGKGSFTMEDAYTIDDLKPNVFDWVVLGHFHKRQTFKRFGHENAFYVGNPIQHNFNDEGQAKGFHVIDTDAGTREFVEIPNRQFLTIDTFDDDAEEKANSGWYYIRYQVTEEQLPALEAALGDDADAATHRIELTKDYAGEQRIDLDFSNTFTEMVEAYAQERDRPETADIGKEIINEASQGV